MSLDQKSCNSPGEMSANFDSAQQFPLFQISPILKKSISSKALKLFSRMDNPERFLAKLPKLSWPVETKCSGYISRISEKLPEPGHLLFSGCLKEPFHVSLLRREVEELALTISRPDVISSP